MICGFYAPKIEGHIVFVILSFCPPLWNFASYFWTVSARALIFHMNIPCDKTFSWVPLFFTLWPWPWSLTHFLKKTLTLLIAFEQWVLELWYFTWVFLVIRPFHGYHYFLHRDLDLGVWPFFENLTLLIAFELWVLQLLHFTWVFLVIRPFRGFIII